MGARLDLPRDCRLVHRAEYDAVYREGRRRTSREFTVFLRPNGLGVSRFGWSIKKALGSAVRRNRIRRRLRETVTIAPTGDRPGMGHCDSSAQLGSDGEILALAAELLALLPARRRNPRSRRRGKIAGGLGAARFSCASTWCCSRLFWAARASFIPPARITRMKPCAARRPPRRRACDQAAVAMPSFHARRSRSCAGGASGTSRTEALRG